MTIFGPSGNDEQFYELKNKGTEQAPKYVSGLGLGAYEYSFGRGVRMGDEKAAAIKAQAELYGIAMSVHAPYFINLAVSDEERVVKNRGYFAESCAAAAKLGASRVIFHPGAVTKMERRTATDLAVTLLKDIRQRLDDSGFEHIVLCAETMGKVNQLGNLEEVIELCGVSRRIIPCIDFGHLYARSIGTFDGYAAFDDACEKLEKGVGEERAKSMHVHFSHIEYTKMGEKRHLTLEDDSFGPNWDELAKVFADRGYSARVLCESSGTMARDSVKMQEIYRKYVQEIEGK